LSILLHESCNGYRREKLMARLMQQKSSRWMIASLGVLFIAGIAAYSRAQAATDGAHEASTWPTSWCQAEPGATREQLVALMGRPTTSLDTQVTWSTPHYGFYAFLAADGTARQLDINTASLSDAEKASLPCATLRTRRSVAAAAAAKVAGSRTARKLTPACELVTALEMSAILGAPVVAQAHNRSETSSQCVYTPRSGVGPSVDLTFSWGDGKAAMSGMALASRHEPGMVSPYEGIGDQAGGAGPLLMIRIGDDLVKLVFSGVADATVAARQIFNTAKPRM
jgi:hypothetical protein